MADITTEITAIEDAIYGREVRGSIVSALTKMNAECQNYQQAQANAEAAIAAATSAATAANAAAQRAEAAAGNITELVPILQRLPEEMEHTPIDLDGAFIEVDLDTAIPQYSTGLVFEFNTGFDSTLKLRSAEMPMPGNTPARYQHAFITGKLGFQIPAHYLGDYKPVFGLVFCYAKNSSTLCVMARAVALQKSPGTDWTTCQIKTRSFDQLKAVYAVVPAE